MAYPYRDWDFEGCDKLKGIGASWFVSYCYWDHIDKTEKHWQNSATAKSRISRYDNSREYHRKWLTQVLCMIDKYLNKNQIGLSSWTIKKMVKKLQWAKWN